MSDCASRGSLLNVNNRGKRSRRDGWMGPSGTESRTPYALLVTQPSRYASSGFRDALPNPSPRPASTTIIPRTITCVVETGGLAAGLVRGGFRSPTWACSQWRARRRAAALADPAPAGQPRRQTDTTSRGSSPKANIRGMPSRRKRERGPSGTRSCTPYTPLVTSCVRSKSGKRSPPGLGVMHSLEVPSSRDRIPPTTRRGYFAS